MCCLFSCVLGEIRAYRCADCLFVCAREKGAGRCAGCLLVCA